MITVEGPIEIKTKHGTIRISICTDQTVIVEVYQRHGKKRYVMDRDVLDGSLRITEF